MDRFKSDRAEKVGSKTARRMVKSDLLGGHTHATARGKNVQVWKRGEVYLVRGRLEGRQFGDSLGSDPASATVQLRRILAELDEGTYRPPSEACNGQIALSRGPVPRFTFRQLAAEFLAVKRKQVGSQTAGDYRVRLMPLLAFAERPENKRRWPLAASIDADFATEAKAYLFSHRTSANGRPGGVSRPLSARQIVNVLQTLRTMLAWAMSPANGRLPSGWVNPVVRGTIGSVPSKDPHRRDPLPLGERIRIVQMMDAWQLCTLLPSMILPMRPDEAAGLLIEDADFEHGELLFGANWPEVNFTKKKVAFRLPFPDEMRPILRACIGGRTGGPLLRNRRAFSAEAGLFAESTEDLKGLFGEKLMGAKGGEVQTAHDRKLLFRGLLRELGGVTEDGMNREFKKLLNATGIAAGSTLYTLRSSVTTSMSTGAKLAHLELTYLTSHSTGDILNRYTSLDIHGEMRKYFGFIKPLLEAVEARCRELNITSE